MIRYEASDVSGRRKVRLGFEESCMAAIKILLVDDDETLNMIRRNLLEREGFDAAVACTVADALKLISSEMYDVLLRWTRRSLTARTRTSRSRWSTVLWVGGLYDRQLWSRDNSMCVPTAMDVAQLHAWPGLSWHG